jgi:hypothetical protein
MPAGIDAGSVEITGHILASFDGDGLPAAVANAFLSCDIFADVLLLMGETASVPSD